MFYQLEHIGAPEYIAVESDRDFSFPAHIHRCFEVVLIREGSMEVKVDDTLYELHKNEAVLIFPNQIHSFSSSKSEHTLCIFSPEIVKAFARKNHGKLPNNNKFTLDETTRQQFYKLGENTTELYKKAILYMVCAIFDESAEYGKKITDEKSLLQQTFEFVMNEFDSDCSLKTLAARLGYNYSYLSRYFKNAVGMSFNAYVSTYRLNNACYLLRNTENTVVECAFESGFVSLRNFNRSFKEQFGITPTEYQRQK